MGINKYMLSLIKTLPFLCISIFNHKKAIYEKNTQFLTILIYKKSTIGDINNFFANC